MIPVVAIVRRMLVKRAPELHACRREIFFAGTALGCVVTLMLGMASVSASHVHSDHSSSPRKLLRGAMLDERPNDGPSVMHAQPVAASVWFDAARDWMAKRPQVVIAVFVYKARSIPNRAPPFC